jgi:hypothetical protein
MTSLKMQCDRCEATIDDYGDVGYDGPKERGSTECSPFMEWEILCQKCASETDAGGE